MTSRNRVDWAFLRRAQLARRVYQEALEATDTFEGPLGTMMVYLMGAILKGNYAEIRMDNVEENEVHQLLSGIFPAEHPVWAYIEVTNESEEN